MFSLELLLLRCCCWWELRLRLGVLTWLSLHGHHAWLHLHLHGNRLHHRLTLHLDLVVVRLLLSRIDWEDSVLLLGLLLLLLLILLLLILLLLILRLLWLLLILRLLWLLLSKFDFFLLLWQQWLTNYHRFASILWLLDGLNIAVKAILSHHLFLLASRRGKLALIQLAVFIEFLVGLVHLKLYRVHLLDW